MNSPFAIAQICTCHDLLQDMRAVSSVKQIKLFKILMPYCLMRHGNGQFVVLNRKYEPLGLNSGKYWKEYDQNTLECLSLDAVDVELPKGGCTENEHAWFYNDATSPYRSSKHLMNYKIRFNTAFRLISSGEVF